MKKTLLPTEEKSEIKYDEHFSWNSKVQISWEEQNIWKDLPLCFDIIKSVQKSVGEFFQILCLLTTSELY